MMGLFKSTTVLNTRELELAEQAIEVAWAKIVRREPKRNTTDDDARREQLPKRLFAMAHQRLSTDHTSARSKKGRRSLDWIGCGLALFPESLQLAELGAGCFCLLQ